MTPPNETKLQQIHDKRIKQIMEAGRRVFARRGIIGTKMSMIASEAGISHGLIYHYFASKDELFTALVEYAMEQSHSAILYAYQLPGSPLDQIRALTELIFREGDTANFVLIHQARTSDDVPDKVKRIMERHSMSAYVDRLLPLFVEGQQAGEIADGDPRELITGYLSVISGLMLLATQEDEMYPAPKVDLLVRMISK